MRITYDDVNGYDIDQQVTIEDMLKNHGMEHAHGIRGAIDEECSENQEGEQEMLPVKGVAETVTIRKFQSLVGSLLWVARCTRPDITFAVHKASRETHAPTTSDWKLAKRVQRYLAGTKQMQLRMRGERGDK
ncbi:hypothetical protein PC129_g918 [Phytophthora cactorum]|uniref:Reverse transcriptase Ty1/copia-type domain-containing protein n=1 Tax=Phytophthora cactorum TaxID=29920 RepID=A0A329SVM3_9STRA|nr:hypothetical protein Pcac1_g26087 [Phytophthora cactorum]KAG2843691.1 hypothetical protein PC112_g2488 [Phytophthora cactorum]KAG2844274.1 hypothetical protein PC111_g2008 [Phytophthora cactorum]KAG2866835.1 hypothetical protein PC113_g2455 [Phytophthora cactorum]KAG2927882.1 hypothetical protein PC114_g3304 [Phytophthora cactorum]